jgi:phenylpropionate dioxygenase-like ring-hydroxylating dioxygenase large terminal subunit
MSLIYDRWYCAAFSDELKADATLTRRILKEPVLLFRTNDGSLASMSSVCPHRFAPLNKGELRDDVIYCPYHGLGFDGAGHCVHNPHGDGSIPLRSDLKRYTVVEHQGVVWIWMGKEGEADLAKIPALDLCDDSAEQGLHGVMYIGADYRLIIDNLLDLNHAPYLHGGRLSPVSESRETNWERGPESAAVRYLAPAVEPSESHKLWFHEPKGDFRTEMTWELPGTLQQLLSMTSVGRPPEEGVILKSAHLITPETERSSHYFWIVTRNRMVGDAGVDQRLRAIIEHAFLNEDFAMIRDVQENMQGREFSDLRPIYLKTDGAAGHARSVLDRASQTHDRPAASPKEPTSEQV